jgi:hypothetical protein
MALLFDTGIFSVEGLSGEILAGAKLYFYASGTSTPQATYSDPSLDPGLANTNPVVASADGRFGPIWLQPLDYKIILKPFDDSETLMTRDPIQGAISGAALLVNADSLTEDAAELAEIKEKLGVPLVTSVTDAAFGAKGDNATIDTAALNAAVDAVSDAGGGFLFFPDGTFLVDGAISLKSHVHLVGTGKTVLKIADDSAFNILNGTTEDLEDIVITGIEFDGSLNYPANSQVYKQTYSLRNTAINIAGVAISGLTVKNCVFTSLSDRSVHVQSDAATDIDISNNSGYQSAYCAQVIYVRSVTTSVTESIRPRGIKINDNVFDTCGPQYHYNPTKEDWIASADAIALDRCAAFTVSGNQLSNVAGIGVRIEESIGGSVARNDFEDIGTNAIGIYKSAFYVSIIGNTGRRWGKIPPAYAIRNYSGTLVYALEFPHASQNPLPADPTASSRWATWPYTTANIDTASIIAYDNTDYYAGSSDGILPFRGYAAIAVNSGAESCTVVGNNFKGDTALSGGKYVYASDFGFSNVHPVNDNGTTNAGQNTVVDDNNFHDVRVSTIYAPAYQDPIGGYGSLGSLIVGLNYEAGAVVEKFQGILRAQAFRFPVTAVASSDPNTLDDYEEGSFTPTVTIGGSSTGITYSTQTGSYTKIGNRVFFELRVVLTSGGGLSGSVRVAGLPFTCNASLSGGVHDVYAANVDAWNVPKNISVVANTTEIAFYYSGITGSSAMDFATYFTNSSELRLSGSYRV